MRHSLALLDLLLGRSARLTKIERLLWAIRNEVELDGHANASLLLVRYVSFNTELAGRMQPDQATKAAINAVKVLGVTGRGQGLRIARKSTPESQSEKDRED